MHKIKKKTKGNASDKLPPHQEPADQTDEVTFINSEQTPPPNQIAQSFSQPVAQCSPPVFAHQAVQVSTPAPIHQVVQSCLQPAESTHQVAQSLLQPVESTHKVVQSLPQEENNA